MTESKSATPAAPRKRSGPAGGPGTRELRGLLMDAAKPAPDASSDLPAKRRAGRASTEAAGRR